MFKKKKQKQQKSNTKATQTAGLVEKENGHYQLDETVLIRPHLKGAAKLIGDSELSKLIKMKMTAPQINKRIRQRFIISLAFLIMFVILGIVDKKHFMLWTLVAAVAAGAAWFFDMKNTDRYFTNYSIQRSIAWSSFVRMAAAYLSELSTGSNMFSVLKKIIPRMATQEDSDNLNRLIIRMSEDPEDSQPFLDFAHSYTSSQQSEMIMLVIQDMYLGNVNDENIQLLANDATQELTSQIDIITQHKLDKFKTTSIQFVMVGMIPMVAYIMYFIWNMLMNLIQSIHL